MLSEAKALIYIANINGETKGNYFYDQEKIKFSSILWNVQNVVYCSVN